MDGPRGPFVLAVSFSPGMILETSPECQGQKGAPKGSHTFLRTMSLNKHHQSIPS